jgi:hypothetical protein
VYSTAKLYLAPFYGNRHVVRLLPFDYPTSIPAITNSGNQRMGYILQAWVMFWADSFSLNTNVTHYSFWYSDATIANSYHHSGAVDYVMFMDTDTILAMPLTCASLFDGDGRLFQPGWSIEIQQQFLPPCIAMTGLKCKKSYMAFFPITFPVRSFHPIRQHMQDHISKTAGIEFATFDDAFNHWAAHANWLELSQFVNMGAVFIHLFPEQVQDVFCTSDLEVAKALRNQATSTLDKSGSAPWSFSNFSSMIRNSAVADISAESYGDRGALCLDFVPPGLHYGWVYQPYIIREQVPQHRHQYWRRTTPFGFAFEWGLYGTFKYGLHAIAELADIIVHGECLREQWERGDGSVGSSATTNNGVYGAVCQMKFGNASIPNIHVMLDLYKNCREVNMPLVRATFSGYRSRFAPDPDSDAPKCSVLARQLPAIPVS